MVIYNYRKQSCPAKYHYVGADSMEYMTADQAREEAKGLTFEIVWESLMESRRRMEESDQRWQKRMDELSKSIGDLGNSLGELTEGIFSPDMSKKFQALGYTFTQQNSSTKYFREDGSILAEVDVSLIDGEYIMLVEVKTKLTERHVNLHVERIEKIRRYMDERSDRRKIVGSMACGIAGEKEMQYAYDHGFYVIVQSGDAVRLADMPQDFRARVW